MAGVPALTLFALLGAAIVRGEHHHSVLAALGVTPSEGPSPAFVVEDLYPDARPALRAVSERGAKVAIAGNFSRSITAEVRGWGLPADVVVSAEELGAEKPDPLFFERLATALGIETAEMLYVGDRVDNDVAGAMAAGCRPVFALRGPWALLQSDGLPDGVPRITALTEVAALL